MVKKRRIAPSGSKTLPERSSRDKVTNARDKFKGALQDLIHRSEDESDSSDEESWSKSKRLTGPRKRYQQNDAKTEPETATPKVQQPFVMKLFDRSVDLAQFNEKTPLYVICRAWMNNQPHQSDPRPSTPPQPAKKDDADTMSDQDENGTDVVKDVHKMPPPLPLTEDSKRMKIPERVKQETNYSNILEENVELPSKETLLKDNLIHWNRVRKSWLAASAKNEKRFEKSGDILSAMFNKAQKQC